MLIDNLRAQKHVREKMIAKSILSGNLEVMFPCIQKQCDKYGISADRYSVFLTCCILDSRYFKVYDIKDMVWTLPFMIKNFTGINSANWKFYKQNKNILLNKFHADYNGNNLKGDGWKFRKRGILKIQGRNDYDTMSYHLSIPLIDDPDMLISDPEIMTKSACIYYNLNFNNLDKEQVWEKLSGGHAGFKNFIGIWELIEACR